MALPPQTSDAFLREVEEEVRRDRAVSFARRWGGAMVVALVLGLVALAAGLWWQSRRQASAEAAAVSLTRLVDALGRGQTADAPAVTGQLAKVPGRAYPAAAAFLKADLALTNGNMAGAATGYTRIMNDTHLPQPVRDAATIRLAGVEFDTAPPATTIARLHGLAAPGSPWFGTAGELTALAYLREGKTQQAGALLAAVAQDHGVPDSIRARTAQLASSLGADVGPLAGEAR